MSADVRTEFDEEDDSEPWYAVKSLIGTYRRASGVRISYEERVVLVRTNDFEKAYELAEDEARSIARHVPMTITNSDATRGLMRIISLNPRLDIARKFIPEFGSWGHL